jgi:hypothetical protein
VKASGNTDSSMFAMISGTDANGSFSITTYMAQVQSAAEQSASEGTSNSYDKQNTQAP